MQIDTTISHNGSDWVVTNESFRISAPTLDEVDSKLKIQLKEKGLITNGSKMKVFMAFDNSTLPQWIRQHSQHYFNRIVEIDG